MKVGYPSQFLPFLFIWILLLEVIKIYTIKTYTDDDLLQLLKNYFYKHNKSPFTQNYQQEKMDNDPHYMTIIRRFGSWENALKLADLPKPTYNYNNYIKYTKQELIDCLIKYYNQYNKVPTTRDFINDSSYPTPYPYRRTFGNWKNALVEAGLFQLSKNKDKDIFNRKPYSKEYLLATLDKYTKEFLKTNLFLMTEQNVNENKNMPSAASYLKYFGGITKAYKLLGYDVLEFNKKQMDKDMINKYRSLCQLYGKTLTSREMNDLSSKNKFYANTAILHHFGSVFNFQIACGITPTVIGRNKTKEEMIEDLKRISKLLGHAPHCKELMQFDDVAGQNAYTERFGSYVTALHEAGLESIKYKLIKTSKGTHCLSYLEYKMACMLEGRNIDFLKDEPYKNFIPNFNRQFTFDFIPVINGKQYFIEIFGIENDDKYEKRKQEKIELCDNYNLPLIQFFFNDFWTCTQEELYNLLLERIQDVQISA